jgi:hypothetical protein
VLNLYLSFRLIRTTKEPLKFRMKIDHNYKLNIKRFISREPGSSVSIVTGYGLDSRGSIPDKGRGFFL